MKANLGIKGLALRHGEKIVIALFGLAALYFVYSSLQLPHLTPDKQADKLQGLITSTNTAMTTSTWEDAAAEEIRKYEPIEQQAAAAVDHTHYAAPSLNPPVVTATLLRGDPVIRNAVAVRASGHSGLLAFRDANTLAEQQRRQALKDEQMQKEAERKAAEAQQQGAEGNRPGAEEGVNNEVFDPENPERRLIEGMGTPAGVPLQGGERLERVSWATVVAKVPIREQLEIFQEAFRNTRGYDPARDFPQYLGYQVQRREMVDGKQTEWKVVNVYDGQKKLAGKNVNDITVAELNRLASSEWAAVGLEPVDARWTDMFLTLPLPPLVGRNFGADATHPDIPLAINAPPPEEVIAPVEGPAAEATEGDDFTASAAGQQRPGGGEMGMRGGGEFGMRGGMGMRGPEGQFGMRGGMGMRGMGGMEGEFGRGGMGGGMSLGGGINSGRTTLPKEVDFLLLRFFDFTVEPGKEYQYRVMVYIADPNNGIPLKGGYLESAVIDRRLKEIQTARAAKPKPRDPPVFRAAEKWSEPSPIVGIPTGGVVHIAEAKVPSTKTANDEPAIAMFAEAFDVEAADGSAIHVAREEKELRRGAVVNLKGKFKYTGEMDRWIDTKDSYALNTGLTVLDIEGGEELGKKMTAPSRVLMMDGAGQIFVRDELADKSSVRYLRFVFSDKPRRGNQAPGGEFGGEMMRGGEGRGRGR